MDMTQTDRERSQNIIRMTEIRALYWRAQSLLPLALLSRGRLGDLLFGYRNYAMTDRRIRGSV